jgi:hypothetical protein
MILNTLERNKWMRCGVNRRDSEDPEDSEDSEDPEDSKKL